VFQRLWYSRGRPARTAQQARGLPLARSVRHRTLPSGRPPTPARVIASLCTGRRSRPSSHRSRNGSRPSRSPRAVRLPGGLQRRGPGGRTAGLYPADRNPGDLSEWANESLSEFARTERATETRSGSVQGDRTAPSTRPASGETRERRPLTLARDASGNCEIAAVRYGVVRVLVYIHRFELGHCSLTHRPRTPDTTLPVSTSSRPARARL
jgi:hypothetical protein